MLIRYKLKEECKNSYIKDIQNILFEKIEDKCVESKGLIRLRGFFSFFPEKINKDFHEVVLSETDFEKIILDPKAPEEWM